jgi:hypothetical protein
MGHRHPNYLRCPVRHPPAGHSSTQVEAFWLECWVIVRPDISVPIGSARSVVSLIWLRHRWGAWIRATASSYGGSAKNLSWTSLHQYSNLYAPK